jgi:hypothetical protein
VKTLPNESTNHGLTCDYCGNPAYARADCIGKPGTGPYYVCRFCADGCLPSDPYGIYKAYDPITLDYVLPTAEPTAEPTDQPTWFYTVRVKDGDGTILLRESADSYSYALDRLSDLRPDYDPDCQIEILDGFDLCSVLDSYAGTAEPTPEESGYTDLDPEDTDDTDILPDCGYCHMASVRQPNGMPGCPYCWRTLDCSCTSCGVAWSSASNEFGRHVCPDYQDHGAVLRPYVAVNCPCCQMAYCPERDGWCEAPCNRSIRWCLDCGDKYHPRFRNPRTRANGASLPTGYDPTGERYARLCRIYYRRQSRLNRIAR